MRILAVAATEAEIPRLTTSRIASHDLDVLITGVGMVATAAHTARALTATRYDQAFNFGVCGCFDATVPLGTVVHVTIDQLSELGAEDGDQFVPFSAMGLPGTSVFTNDHVPDNAVLRELPVVTGITVNTVHGHEPTIGALRSRLQPHVESMEGAAFAQACAIAGVPYAQVRAISNAVGRRNRDAWRLELAIHNLNDVARRIIEAA
jgi:futalosine hydrolase